MLSKWAVGNICRWVLLLHDGICSFKYVQLYYMPIIPQQICKQTVFKLGKTNLRSLQFWVQWHCRNSSNFSQEITHHEKSKQGQVMGAEQHVSVMYLSVTDIEPGPTGDDQEGCNPSTRGPWLLGGNTGSRTLTTRWAQAERTPTECGARLTQENRGDLEGFEPLPVKPVLHLSQPQSRQREQSPHRWLLLNCYNPASAPSFP